MADTSANQEEYPQHAKQEPGCGFPLARIVVVFSLAVGTVLDAALGRNVGKLTVEISLFRSLEKCLEPGDVVLADRAYCGWFDLACQLFRGVDTVVRKHQRRKTDFRFGTRLGRRDHLITWDKPTQPDWLTEQQYAQLPDELTVREIQVD